MTVEPEGTVDSTVNVTFPLKSFTPRSVMVDVPEIPGGIFRVFGLASILKSAKVKFALTE